MLIMISPFQSIVIYKRHQYLKETYDALQDETHSNQVSLSTGTSCRKEHQI
jgi:hypothetical protein